ncbi:right-handed parallel beta-helix repeat-containing protein [Thioclava atlantica]|uniref:PKD domain-containing protein n=1 Tax=Thioclava atlantica TaxID=1317124 RepID=A0A085TS73_9RHOB|nr:right-handed parallel beta-helix repeat-containing protein [Thioclava atlantica]KFE33570.1 hypothetical protein DW2_17170 [Thioclava atlantica]
MEQIAQRWGQFARAARRGLFGCALALVAVTPGFAKDWRVAAPGELAQVLERVVPGDVVDLAPGRYPELVLNKVAGAQGAPITIRSAEPGHPAQIARMDLREVSHLVLDRLIFDYRHSQGDAANLRPFQVFTTRDLTIRDSLFDGDLAPPDPALTELGPLPTAFGLAVRASTGITIEDNEFRLFYRGAIVTDCTDVVLRGNDIHDMRMDGLNFAQVERVRIEKNHIHDFRRALGSGDHADMIQFWTARTERPTRDVVIAENVLNSGFGGFTQSIFIRNEMVDRGEAGREMYYRNLDIRDNVIVNAHLHGISVGETDGLRIENNTLIHDVFSEGEKRDPRLWIPQIRVAKSARNVTIARNAVGEISGPVGQSDWRVTGNRIIQDLTPGRPDYYDALFVAARTGLPTDLRNFAYLPGGALAGTGVGAPQLDTLGAGNSFQPVMRVAKDASGGTALEFDASGSVLPEGIASGDVRYVWQIAEAAPVEGARVPMRFTHPGSYDVTLSATLPDGRVAKSQGRVVVRDDRILSYDPQLGRIISHAGAEPKALDSIQISPGALEFGLGGGSIDIPPEMIAPFFGADHFEIHLKLRAQGGYKSAGEVLRVHQSLIVTASGRGTLRVEFWPANGQRLLLRTRSVPLYDGNWHDITLRYSSAETLFEVLADDEVIGKGTVSGRVRPMEYWGLSLGNPFGDRPSFHGEIRALDLRATGPAVMGAQR